MKQPSLVEQKLYWENRWNRIRVPNDWSHQRGATVLNLLRRVAPGQPKVLDMGCGTGWFARDLVKIGDVTGIDLSETAIEIAGECVPEARFMQGDVYSLQLPEKHFDVVISMQVLSHVQDQPRYLARAAQFVKPGGYFILTTDNRFVVQRADTETNPSSHIEDYLTRRELLRLLRRDFRIVETTSIIVTGNRGCLRLINSAKANAMLNYVFTPDRLAKWKEKAGLGNTWVMVARKH
jgi:2-polyprenyl-3-methyl-5-hydroxy-6-metoxy-1,4-benzoquinol methylase